MKKNRVNILLAALTMSMAVTATGCGTKREEKDVMDNAAVLEEADTQIEETETAEAEIQSMETEDVRTKSEKGFETELNSNKTAVSDSTKNKQNQVSARKKPSTNGKKNTDSEKNKMSVSGAADSAKDTAASDGKQNQSFPEEKESRPEPVPDMPSASEGSDVNISISIPEQTPAQEPIAPVPDQNGNDASEAPAAPDYNYSTEGLPPKPDPEEENDWEKSELPVIPGVEFNTN